MITWQNNVEEYLMQELGIKIDEYLFIEQTNQY